MKNKVKCGILVRGGLQHERHMTRSVIIWCMDHFNLDVHTTKIDVTLEVMTDCNGTCVDNDEGGYDITISINQTLRDFVATIVHEMVHLKQYVTGEWQGNGEKECDELQYVLADKIWNEGIL